MKTKFIKLILLIPVFLLAACDNNPHVVCKDGIAYNQIGVIGSVYQKTNIACIDIKESKEAK